MQTVSIKAKKYKYLFDFRTLILDVGPMIKDKGWADYSTWDHSASLKELYSKRCLKQAEEMTCHAQAVELLSPKMQKGETLLDVGCGSGYFYHSLASRNMQVNYFGIDASPTLIEVGRQIMPTFGLPKENLKVLRIEDLSGEVDHVACINVLSNLDNYHRPLERILKCARKSVILRESIKDGSEYLYVKDKYLDPGVDLKVHVNAYDTRELTGFIESYGYKVKIVEDRHTGGKPQMIIEHPHYWTFVIAERTRP